ncbi:Deoxyribodipyrimidine photolyase [Rubellimicrobium mesophilum DSM 19309]|uniref:Deoxyribodipyrimidine photolyase n=1 Tax=Rubellimicrobium mesophilum DSM 19309 TaxID=442562 RepID=A0A017HMW1_9RHOB|nr:deoxyribodipyrimidine photo-lyase [Rubellimicrobium mesophilum]EYD75832.1 Deoxyribodipyrimidine photolyase [Rubellimicrobium mesophilum DSM 19309]
MPHDRSPILLWFRRDLRLSDHPALHAAAASGRPVIPVFLCDEGVEALGAAPRMRIGLGVEQLARDLKDKGSRLILRRGATHGVLRAMLAETGAGAVWWTRLHDPLSRRQDECLGPQLESVETRAFPGHLLHEPETLRTGAGGSFRSYAAFFRALRTRDMGEPLPPPSRLTAPASWPATERLEDWRLDAAMNRGGSIVASWQQPGETQARARLDRFVAERIGAYAGARDYPGRDGSSRLSENLAYGEISARTCWLAALAALHRGEAGAEQFLKELAWRDFSHHLLFHSPELATDAWRPEWRSFPWTRDTESPLVSAWRRGRTGIRLVDAAMREMYVTGRMHNRSRMIVASLLTKHMLTDWRIGLKWFEDCLTDWDPASNAVNWQWVAGSGPDASPFFRIFSPKAQAKAYDPDGDYARAWIAEWQAAPPSTALSYFEAIPRSWHMSQKDTYPAPVLDLAVARRAALAAFRARPWDQDATGQGGA